MVRFAFLWLVGACNYAPTAAQVGSDGPDSGDAAPDGPPGDAQLCFTGFTPVCLATAPSAQLVLSTTDTIATDGPRCVATTMGTAANVCVVAATSIQIAAGVTIAATGPKPLVLLATTGTIEIAGTLDAASHIGGANGAGFDPAACPPGTAPTHASGSGGGGYGGTFGGIGGDGGLSVNRGAAGIAFKTAAQPTVLRGGCGGRAGAGPGQGAGGAGGGAVELNAPAIEITGTINASGAGGNGGINNDAGGGGGGSGGMIVFSTPAATVSGSVFAQGGGGGGGAGGSGAAQPGMDPGTANVGAPPGDGFHDAGGTFGAGGVGATAGDGGLAQDGTLIGGGGGGGGTGVIKSTTVTPTGTVPPAS